MGRCGSGVGPHPRHGSCSHRPARPTWRRFPKARRPPAPRRRGSPSSARSRCSAGPSASAGSRTRVVQVAEQAGTTLALGEVLQRVCRLTVDLMPCDQCTVYMWSSRRRAYIPVADQGSPPHVVARFVEKYYRRGGYFFEEALRGGRTLIFSRDESLSPEARELLDDSEKLRARNRAALRPRDPRGRALRRPAPGPGLRRPGAHHRGRRGPAGGEPDRQRAPLRPPREGGDGACRGRRPGGGTQPRERPRRRGPPGEHRGGAALPRGRRRRPGDARTTRSSPSAAAAPRRT